MAQTRWPERETVADWSQGVPLTKLRALVEYWRTGYDWRRFEAKLNGFAQYRTELDGLNIHFLHVRSRHAHALPIIITHGWPGSVIEFFKIIDPLTNPTAHGGHAEDAFHVVAPSLPGFGFSDKPTERGWNNARIARAWAELMRRLAYTRYVAQGGDWGSVVATTLAQQRPAGLAGIHLNMPFVFPDPIPTTGLSAAEQRAVDAFKTLSNRRIWLFPSAVDAPANCRLRPRGFAGGTGCLDLRKISRLDRQQRRSGIGAHTRQDARNITLYRLTDTATSSARMYFEHAGIVAKNNSGVVELPVGCSIFPREIVPAPPAGPTTCFPSSFTGTSSIAVAISLRLNSRHCSQKNCAIAFALCADSPE